MSSVRSSHGRADVGLYRLRWSTFVLLLSSALTMLCTTRTVGQANHGAASKEAGSLIHDPLPRIPDDRVTGPNSAAVSSATADESCFMWPLAGVHPLTEGLASLRVNGQARKDFQRACKALYDKQLAKAEEHLRRAVRTDAEYPAAWVLLGQVLKAQQKTEDAREACAQAVKVDPNYLPAGLCLADIYAIQQKWGEMLRAADASIALDPTNNFHAYFYAAGANLALRQLPEAEKNALKAAEIDKDLREPRTHFLLAQIYELQHKPDLEAAQLREYLKSATDPQDVAMVKKYLADLTEKPIK
jgi:tetratricopeptide (TPR) repeat protein